MSSQIFSPAASRRHGVRQPRNLSRETDVLRMLAISKEWICQHSTKPGEIFRVTSQHIAFQANQNRGVQACPRAVMIIHHFITLLFIRKLHIVTGFANVYATPEVVAGEASLGHQHSSNAYSDRSSLGTLDVRSLKSPAIRGSV